MPRGGVISDLERKLLARMGTPEGIAEIWDAGVRAEWFADPLYGNIFAFVLDYWHASHMKLAPTSWALSQQFPGYVAIEQADELTEYLIALMRQHYTTNQLQGMLRKAAAGSLSDPDTALKELHVAAYVATEAVMPRILSSDMTNVEEREQRYQHREDHPEGLGVLYGLDLLDVHTGGVLPGELAIVGGTAKVGKSMFLLHTAVQAARAGLRPVVYTLEMSIAECEDRIDAFYSGLSYNRLSRGHLSPEEKERLLSARKEIAGRIFIERPVVGDRTVPYLCSRARQRGADLLVIDQLSFMDPNRKVNSLKEHHSVIMSDLKNEVGRSGKELPCLLAVQATRASAVEGLTLHSFSNAIEIEQTCDIALGLWQTQALRNQRSMRLDILGSRRSDKNAYLLEWNLISATSIRVLEQIRE